MIYNGLVVCEDLIDIKHQIADKISGHHDTDIAQIRLLGLYKLIYPYNIARIIHEQHAVLKIIFFEIDIELYMSVDTIYQHETVKSARMSQRRVMLCKTCIKYIEFITQSQMRRIRKDFLELTE